MFCRTVLRVVLCYDSHRDLQLYLNPLSLPDPTCVNHQTGFGPLRIVRQAASLTHHQIYKQEGNVLINLRRQWFTCSLAMLHMFIGSHVHWQCFTCSLARIFSNVSFFENSMEVT